MSTSPHPAGSFMVVQTTGWAARAIQLGTRSGFNHAAIADGMGNVIEAQPGGVRKTPESAYDGCSRLWSAPPPTTQQATDIVGFGEEHLGQGYGWKDIVALALASLHIRWPWVDARLRDPSTVICSQLVAEAYAFAGITLVPGKDPARVTPGDLADVLTDGTVPADY